MRIKLLIIALCAVVFALAATYDLWHQPNLTTTPKTTTNIVYATAPQVNLTTIKGQHIGSFNDLAEPVIIVNFWASWCAPCAAEMPDMLNLVEQFKGQVALVTISIDNQPQAIEKFAAKLGRAAFIPHSYWVWDEAKQISLTQFGVIKVPETIILNRHRNMVRKIVGEHNWASPQMVQYLQGLLND